VGASSYIERNAPIDLLRIDPSIEQVQFPNIGDILWKGLDDNESQIKRSIDVFLNNQPPPSLYNYPQRKDITSFFTDRL